MYAVGKVSSFISRSVYTVSGPFHPFGGAVDVVVVQQQDGSFKSSPWYVRFGKFQGVLKTREKVVNIAVNGEEAGFHMYLDSNGEAFFLRNWDPDLDEGEFVMSPVSSDDEEREVRVRDAQLRKSKSISCDSSTMEADATDGNIFVSRRTTILDRMFGRKSAKDSARAVDRVSSLERAEIAAELLDTNWSTNPSRAPRSRKSKDEPSSKSNLADAGSGNLVETSKIVLPVGSFDHEKAVGSNCDGLDGNSCSLRGGTNSSEDGNVCSVQTTIVKAEVVEICTHDSGGLTDGITSITEQPESKSMSSDPGTDKIIDESISTQSETLGNFEDNEGREMNTKEVISHDIFEIRTIEADITHGKSEVFSQLVTADSNGAHRNFIDANSPVHGATCLSSEKHDISLIASAQDACEEKMVIISSSETLESSYDASGILADKVCDAVSIPMPDGVQLEECSRFYTEKIEHVIFEDKPLSYYGASSNKEETSNLDIQDKEIFVLGASSSQISQANCPDNDISDDSVVNDHVMHSAHGSDIEISMNVVANDHSTHTCHDLASQHDLVFPDASSSAVEISNDVPENGPRDVTMQDNVESKTCSGDLDVPVIHISTTGDETREFISQSANSPDKSSNKEEMSSLDIQDKEIFVLGASSSQISQANCPDKDIPADSVVNDHIMHSTHGSDVEISMDVVANDHSTHACHDLASQHDLVFPDASSSVVEISNYVPENDAGDVTMQGDVESKTCNGDLDIPVIHISTTGDETRECTSESADSPDNIQPEGLQIFSDFSSLGKPEAEASQHDLIFPDASSSVVEISNYVPENDPRDVTTQGDVENQTCNGDLDIPDIHISTTRDETRECISESANSTDNVQPEGLQIFSDFSSLGKPESEASQHDLVFPDASSSVVEISNYVPENDPADVTVQTNVESKTCNGDLDIPVIHISTAGDETRECISQSVNSPDRVQPEGLQFFSDLSSVGKLEEETTKQEDDENRSSSASGVEIEIVPEATYEPKEEPEAVVSCSEFVEGIQFQFSDTESFADRNNRDDVIANKAACAGHHDEFDCGTEQQGLYDTALESNPENHSDSSRLETTPVPFPQSELHLGDDNLEAKSLPNLHSHIHDLQRSDCAQLSHSLQPNGENNALENIVPIPGSELRSGDDNLEDKSLPKLCLHNHIHDLERSDCVQLSSSLQTNGENNGLENSVPLPGSELHSNPSPHIHDIERSDYVQLSCSPQSNSENNGVDPVKTTNSVFPEQEPKCPDDSEETCGPSELTNNGLPDDLKVDSFNPFAELSLCRHLLSEGMGADAACKAFDAEKISLEKFRAMKESLIRDSKLVVRIAGRYFPWDAAAPVVLGMVSFREEQVFESQGMIKVERVEPGGSWRIWPFSFKKTRSISTVQPVCESTVESTLPTPVKESDRENTKPSPRVKRMERKVRSLTPTSEELASLHLREGKNIVTFTFSTGMLGKQQVDAHIYLWKWNTRVVISDVDGTITKSDVLGQFMPLVGVDWSQNGVAHLFSAIKENGYQLLFLSARSISQAHITRQFLFNLKQDGKALPDGPVVISPDGLFPSLYREVIRRAPHEFKISCLETIKQLFPLDSLPFYAGFGNRDTDELSYLKVGIPMGKIFIINPKGEVAVNRRVDTKSYTSLHSLVNGMFPPISSSSEQEDYNTWNYWKMPLPSVDI